MVRGGSSSVLYSALERLFSDGLRDGCTLWKTIVTLTKPGKATSTIYETVQQLEASEKPINSRIQTFFKELLRLQSVDGYLSYVVLKEKQLAEMYSDTAFLLRAHTAYRSLFWRLIESLELLSVLTQCERSSVGQPTTDKFDSPSASRLPSDSRIPKSTSEPLRLSVKVDKGRLVHRSLLIPYFQVVEASQPKASLDVENDPKFPFLSVLTTVLDP